MKVVILAGGFGARLGRITESIPKPMLTIGNKPVIWHIMKIYAHYGYKDFIICLGYKGKVIKEYFLNYNSYNNDLTIDLRTNKVSIHQSHDERDWNITLIDTGLNTLKGGRLKRVERYLDDINMLTYGDGVADVNVNDLVDFHKSQNKLLTITGVHPPARFGEIIEKDGQLISFEEKPQTSIGLINGGFMVFDKRLLDYLTDAEDCDLEYGTFEKLVSEQQVVLYKHEKGWGCLDTERDLKYLNNLWNENKAFWKVW